MAFVMKGIGFSLVAARGELELEPGVDRTPASAGNISEPGFEPSVGIEFARCWITGMRRGVVYATNCNTKIGYWQESWLCCNRGGRIWYGDSVSQKRPALFRGRHFQDVIIVQCVRWYLRYSLSYRDLEEMMPGAV